MDLIGREAEIETLLAAAEKKKHILITGRLGIGKSALLRALHSRLPKAIMIPSGTPKTAMLGALEGAHAAVGLRVQSDMLPPTVAQRAKRRGYLKWSDLSYTLRRLPLSRQAELLQRSLAGKGAVVLIDSLEVPPTLAESLEPLFDVAQVIAAKDDSNRRVRIERLMWRFATKIELKPLTNESAKALAERAIGGAVLRFSSDRVQNRFIRHVVNSSRGIPAAILGLVESAAAEQEITPAKASSLNHEAARDYLDMTPIVVLLLFIFIAMRYISRGMDSQELLILSGVASALFMAVRFSLMLMKRR